MKTIEESKARAAPWARKFSRKGILIAMACAMACASRGNEIYTYELLPGSTIYPLSGATQTGPAQALTGTFQLTYVDQLYQAVTFDLASASYTLTLVSATDVTKELGFRLNPYGEITVFGGLVNTTGLGVSQGQIGNFLNGPGYYEGPEAAPTFLSVQGITIAPVNGGYWCAGLSFTAELVSEVTPTIPDESPTALLFLGGLVFCWSLRRLHSLNARPENLIHPHSSL